MSSYFEVTYVAPETSIVFSEEFLKLKHHRIVVRTHTRYEVQEETERCHVHEMPTVQRHTAGDLREAVFFELWLWLLGIGYIFHKWYACGH